MGQAGRGVMMNLLGTGLTAVLLLLSVHVIRVKATETCPHERSGLRRWSDKDGWTKLGLSKPEAGDEVEITDDVLLDESPPALKSIEIQAGGSLVFSPDDDYTLVTGYMMIHGALYFGSERCKFPAKAKITLTGKRNEQNVEGFGGKFIGVAEGATLELHGQNKLAWTKLSTTLPKLTLDNGLIYDYQEDKTMDRGSLGLTVFVLDGATGSTKFSKTIYLLGGNSYRLTNDPPHFFRAMNNVSDGDVVAMAVQRDDIGDENTDMDPFYDAIENATLGKVTNTLAVRNLEKKNAWVLVAVKGKFVKEKLEKRIADDSYCRASLTVPLPKLGVVVSLESKTRPVGNVYWGKVRALAAPMDIGARKVDLASEASTWRPGDRLVVTSTDYDHRQAEVGEVGYCSPEDCKPSQIRLLLFPQYMHYGEVADGVDMRAEVALLSRNIVIEGRMENKCPNANQNCDKYFFDTYGGHIKIEKDFASVRIEGVELRHMGQLTEVDRHPIYFHMCGNSTVPAYVNSVSIKDTYNMCIAVKGTHSLLLQDNVAYNHFGHCYALLEGGEKGNILDGNLGAGTKEYRRTDLTWQSTTFFITNPLTYVKNNVAAGGNRRGIWYVFPQAPLGESKNLNLMAKHEARKTPLAEFYNNAAHSYGDSGLFIENELRDKSAGGGNLYTPLEDPLDPDSKPQEVVLHRFTGFKNRQRNALIRGGYITMDQASLADSARGVYFTSTNGDFKTLQNSIIVGESANIGEPDQMWVKAIEEFYNFPRSIPFTWDYQYPIQGITVQDGPLRVRSVWFNHFQPNENRSSAAIGFSPTMVWPSFANNYVKDLQFGFEDGEATGLRMYEADDSVHGFGSKAGDMESILYDMDGSLCGVPDTTLVQPFPIYTTAHCHMQDTWGMAVCPHRYAKANLALPTVDLLPATSLTAPSGLGAGEFLPLTTRSVVDGAYGDWSEWGPCTTTCGGGTQIRSRACDSPIPQNEGKPCVGPSEETQGCSTNPCEIHGNFTTWSSWSLCNAIEGNGNINGYQIRSRACDNPAPQYNGDVCVGDTKEINKCLIAASA